MTKVEDDSLKRHKHADLIIAWANGAEIEVEGGRGASKGLWQTIGIPSWLEHSKYRIKPTKTQKELDTRKKLV